MSKIEPGTVEYYRTELAIKALEKTEHLVDAYHAGKISEQAFDQAIESIWWIVSGLIDRDIEELIGQAPKEARKVRRVA